MDNKNNSRVTHSFTVLKEYYDEIVKVSEESGKELDKIIDEAIDNYLDYLQFEVRTSPIP